MQEISGKVAVIGVGYSKITRSPQQSMARDTVEACKNAVADAGLKVSDVDGLSTAAEQPFANAGHVEGVDLVPPGYLLTALGMDDVSFFHRDTGMIGTAFTAAANAVAAGVCKYALVWRALSFPRDERYGRVDPEEAAGPSQFLNPYGHTGTGAPGHAQLYRRYMEKYGAKREHLATFISNNRSNALLNERGYWRNYKPEPLSVEQYMHAPMISDPFCLHDCDLPVQGCAAWLLTSAERAKDAPHAPAYLAGYAQGGLGGMPALRADGQLEEYQAVSASLAQRLWRDTGFSPKDITSVNLYDGFSIFLYVYLEALGFCKEGEAFEFIQDGRVSLSGALPVNTSGGNLGEGRMHGAPHITEAVLQAAGRAGPRQVRKTGLTLSCIGMPRFGLLHAMLFSPEPLGH